MQWGLDVDKFIAFGFDNVATMTNKGTRIVTHSKNQVNPFLTSIYCVAHQVNLIDLDAFKAPSCKELSKDIDNIISDVAGHFKKSLKHKNTLQRLQLKLNDT